MFMGL